jgi:hypothetical protein
LSFISASLGKYLNGIAIVGVGVDAGVVEARGMEAGEGVTAALGKNARIIPEDFGGVVVVDGRGGVGIGARREAEAEDDEGRESYACLALLSTCARSSSYSLSTRVPSSKARLSDWSVSLSSSLR